MEGTADGAGMTPKICFPLLLEWLQGYSRLPYWYRMLVQSIYGPRPFVLLDYVWVVGGQLVSLSNVP